MDSWLGGSNRIGDRALRVTTLHQLFNHRFDFHDLHLCVFALELIIRGRIK